MSLNEIIDRFALVSGFTMDEISRDLPLIRDCMEYFEERVADDLSDSQRRRLAQACAVFAYYRLCLLSRSGELSSFKAGDVQIQQQKSAELCEAAERMWESERAMISDIASFDDGFAFRSVSV